MKNKSFITVKKSLIVVVGVLLISGCSHNSGKEIPKYQNPDLTVDERVDDLMSRMTLEEKISQLRYDAPAIERLDIAEYNWWNECLHGVARSGKATVFPQAIGLAAMWDRNQMFKVATAISDEARAKHHDYLRRNKHGIYQGLTFWTPNINIFRDPRWGRGMETYGEDPFLTGELGVQFVKGLQGDDPKYLKTVSTVKHFAVHSGPEPERHRFDAKVSDRDLFETYLPHFKNCIINGKAQSVMCAYNLYQGEPCCGNTYLLEDVLRKSWGFDGYVVSDCWALTDFFNFQKTAKNSAEAGAIAIKAGTDLNCGVVYRDLQQAIDSGFIREDKINLSLKRVLKARFQLGMFDPAEKVAYAQIPIEVNDCDEHHQLALITAQKSMVLLKNEGNLLPLPKTIKSIAVIGPNADDVEVLLGNYNGTPSNPITPLRGIREKLGGSTEVIYAHGCDWADGMPKLVTVPAAYLTHLENGKAVAGWVGEFYDNLGIEGAPVVTKTAGTVNFKFWMMRRQRV
jgi:beta-glucosidase